MLERAEREYRRKLDELRATEAQRHAERDRAVTSEVKEHTNCNEYNNAITNCYGCPFAASGMTRASTDHPQQSSIFPSTPFLPAPAKCDN